jgi:EamA domain-containing membrane protein RarD
LLSLPYSLAEKEPGWIAVIILSAILAIVFFVRASRVRKSDAPASVWKINRGYGLFFVALVACRTLFIFSDFEQNVNGTTPLYSTYVLVGFLCILAGLVVIASLADTYMLARPRKTLTWVVLAVLATNVVFLVFAESMPTIDLTIPRWVQYISIGLVFLIVLFVFLSLARQSTGTLRRNALITLLGLGIALIGSLLDSASIAQLNIIPIYLPPIIMFVGIIFFALGQREV